MRKFFHILKYILIPLLLLVITVSMGLTYSNNKKIENFEKQYDTRLAEHLSNEAIALKYLDVLTIVDSNSYLEVKEKLYSDLSGKLQQELFRHEEYTLPERYKVRYKVKDIKGMESNGVYIYKIAYTVESLGFKREIITLITVENKKITNVETL